MPLELGDADAPPRLAAGPACRTAFATQNSVAFGQRLVSTGDSVGKVIEVADQPDRTVRLENSQGGAAGERFEYYLRGKTVTLWIHGGRVVAIEEVLD